MGERESAVLRVLTALAWADGTVTGREADMLDRAAAEFGLSREERARFAQLREEPVPLDRFEELARELRALVSTPEARREVMEYAHALSAEDGISPEESRWLRALERLLDRAEPSTSFFSRVRAALAPVLPSSGAAMGRPGAGGAATGAAVPREEMERRVLGGLLARRVILAGGTAAVPPGPGVVNEAAVHEGVRRFLQAAGVQIGELDHLVDSIQRSTSRDEDRQRLCASVNRVTEYEGRVRILAALFHAPAERVGDRAAVEAELRRIANYLWIEPQEFTRLRAQAAAFRPELPSVSPRGDERGAEGRAAGGPAA